jgi:thiol-disulfide isomerase/thioredoxin
MRLRNITGFILVLGFLFISNCTKQDQKERKESPQDLLQPISPTQIDSVIHQYQGKKAVLVNLWATWCGPCVEEFPYIVTLQQKYPDQLHVIFISGDFTAPYKVVPAFLKEHNVDWTTYLKTGDDQEFINALDSTWTGAMPFTKIYDKNGTVVARWENSADYDTFQNYVEKAIQRR